MWEKEWGGGLDCWGQCGRQICVGWRVGMRSVRVVVVTAREVRSGRPGREVPRQTRVRDFPDLAREEHLWVSFPAGPPPTSCGMQRWSPPSAPWLLAPPPREPGPTDQHAPKDGPQGWPVQPGQSVGSSHFSPTPLGMSFPSVQLSSARLVSRSPLPLSRPVQTISLGRKEVGVQVAFSLLLVPSRARASRASSLQNSVCPASPISAAIGPAQHTLCSLPFHQFSPDQEDSELCLCLPVLARFCSTTLLLLTKLSRPLFPLTDGFAAALGVRGSTDNVSMAPC